MRALSSNHFSHDLQVADVIDYLIADELTFKRLNETFPELEAALTNLASDNKSSWVDTGMLGLDPDFMSWVTDWIEENTSVYWEDGEPWVEVD